MEGGKSLFETMEERERLLDMELRTADRESKFAIPACSHPMYLLVVVVKSRCTNMV